nr:20S proteasome subunit beta 4 [Kwoniella bestiolae CBS 10118]OCF28107.1 20S proteasome subunit beta 4 [Kwoniella bestiolae CBS 10118]
MAAGRSIIRMKSDENKIKALGPHLAMAYGGEPGDTNNFAEYVERNMRLYHIRNHYPLLPASASAWIRRTLAESIRSRNPYAVNLLLAGYDTTTSKPHLYWIDYLGTKAVVPYAAHGMGVYVSLSTMDKWWFNDMNKREGVEVLKKCIDEVQKRITVHFNFNCILIDKDGIHNINIDSQDPLAELESESKAASGDIVVDAPNSPLDVGVTA